jgi:alpha-ketoglutarate-dependent taurine dioxygenase/biotin carboxylase
MRKNENQDFVNIIDLNQSSSRDISELKSQIFKYKVIVLRNGQFDLSGYVDLMKALGQPVHHILAQFCEPNFREVLRISNYYIKGQPYGVHEGGSYWHTDMSYKKDNSVLTSLFSKSIPKINGSTQFIDCVGALQILEKHIQNGEFTFEDISESDINSFQITHRFGNREQHRTKSAPSQKLTQSNSQGLAGDVVHPLILTHPVTQQRSLYAVAATSIQVNTYNEEKSFKILDKLFDFVLKHAPRYSHEYHLGDIVIWDNLSTLHKGPVIPASTNENDCRILYRINVNYLTWRPVMKKIIIFLTPYYINFASEKTLSKMSQHVRTVMIMDEKEELPAKLVPYFHEVHKVNTELMKNVRPVLSYQACKNIISNELKAVEGNPNFIRIFCQEECHVLDAAKLRNEFGIPGDEESLVMKFRNKILMKQAVAAHGIRIPTYEALDKKRLLSDTSDYYKELKAKYGLPIVIKPVDSAGSFEVVIINNQEEFIKSKSNIEASEYHFEYEVDKYIETRPMYQCDSYVREGKVEFCGILELGCTNFDFVQGKPLSVISALPHDVIKKLELFNQQVITALGFKNGSTHHELFFNSKEAEPIFLEIAARVPGGIAIPFHEKNTGFNLIDAVLFLTLGWDLMKEITPHPKHNLVSALLPLRPGKIVELCDPEIKSKFDPINWKVKLGQIVDSRSLADNAGILTLYNDNPHQLKEDFLALQSYIPVKTEPMDDIKENALSKKKPTKQTVSSTNTWFLLLAGVAGSAVAGGLMTILCKYKHKPINYKQISITAFSGALLGAKLGNQFYLKRFSPQGTSKTPTVMR